MASDPDWMSQRIAQNPSFDCVEMESESLLYDTATHNVVYLDAPALIVWRLCDGERSVAEIVALIEDAYPRDRESIAQDVHKTVDALAKSGAVVFRA